MNRLLEVKNRIGGLKNYYYLNRGLAQKALNKIYVQPEIFPVGRITTRIARYSSLFAAHWT